MPWRLIIFIVILGFVVFFAGFNVANVSDISFGFYALEDVPIFISLFVAFLVGTLVMLPFVGRRGIKNSAKKPEIQNSDDDIPILPSDEGRGAKKLRKKQ